MSARFALLLALPLVGCSVSSDTVRIEAPDGDASATSLSVAWSDLQARLGALEAELDLTRAQLAGLCADSAVASRPLCARLAAAERGLASVEGRLGDRVEPALAESEDRLSAIETRVAPISVDRRTGDVYFTGVNVHIRNGKGETGVVDGKGNLILGWNEAGDGRDRTGSHNLVVGPLHGWAGYAGIAAGHDHYIEGAGASALGGEGNEARAAGSVALGGESNIAAGPAAVVVGGADNVVEGELATGLGGFGNDLGGDYAVGLGGREESSDAPFFVRIGSRLLGDRPLE